ncbi:MAG: hypothetical protein AB7T01_10985 [Acidithiobacillus sp.]
MPQNDQYMIDLDPFFTEPRGFLQWLRACEYQPFGYDCSGQLAIRLMREANTAKLPLTPRQGFVMNQIIDEALRRASALIAKKIAHTGWSIPDYSGGDDHDLAWEAATKALQILVEKHDFALAPHPGIAAFVGKYTQFSSRSAVEDFVYRKRLKSDSPRPIDSPFTKAHLERSVRQTRSELKNASPSDIARRARLGRKLSDLETTLYGITHEIRIDHAVQRGDETEQWGDRLSVEVQLALSVTMDDQQDEDDSFEVKNLWLLETMLQIRQKNIPAKALIPSLATAKEFRALVGILKLLCPLGGGKVSAEAKVMKEILGRDLPDLRKQMLRSGSSDNEDVVMLFDRCRSFISGECEEADVLFAAQMVAAL